MSLADRFLSYLALLLGKPRPGPTPLAVARLHRLVTKHGIEVLADSVRHVDPAKRDELAEALRQLAARLEREGRVELSEEVLFLWKQVWRP